MARLRIRLFVSHSLMAYTAVGEPGFDKLSQRPAGKAVHESKIRINEFRAAPRDLSF